MVIGRQKMEWDRGAFFVAQLHRSLTGQTIDHTTLIPDLFKEVRTKREKTEEELRFETKIGLSLLSGARGERI